MAERIIGLILAGGQARRFGGIDKGLEVHWQQQPLIAHAVQRLQPQVDELWLVANRNSQHYSRWADRILADANDFRFDGPLAGILAGLEQLAETSAQQDTLGRLCVVPVDAPWIATDLVKQLQMAGDGLVVAQGGGRLQPAFGLWPASLAEPLRQALQQGQRRLGAFVQQQQAALAAGLPAESFYNINDANNLQQLSEA